MSAALGWHVLAIPNAHHAHAESRTWHPAKTSHTAFTRSFRMSSNRSCRCALVPILVFVFQLPQVAAREPVVLEGHKNAVTGLAFSPDGTTLASAGLDDAVKFW